MTTLTKDRLLHQLREEFEDELDFGGKTWWLTDLAEELGVHCNQLLSLLTYLQDEGKLSVYRSERRADVFDYFINLCGFRAEWD